MSQDSESFSEDSYFHVDPFYFSEQQNGDLSLSTSYEQIKNKFVDVKFDIFNYFNMDPRRRHIFHSIIQNRQQYQQVIQLERQISILETEIQDEEEKMFQMKRQQCKRREQNSGKKKAILDLEQIFKSEPLVAPQIDKKPLYDETTVKKKEEALYAMKKYLSEELINSEEKLTRESEKLSEIQRKRNQLESELQSIQKINERIQRQQKDKLLQDKIHMEEMAIQKLKKCIEKLRQK